MRGGRKPKLLLVLLTAISTVFWTSAASATVTEEWVRLFDSPDHGSDAVQDLVLDSAGNIFVTGTTSGLSGAYSDITTLGYDTDGNNWFIDTYDGPGMMYDSGRAVATDSSGNVFVTGSVDSGSITGGKDVVLLAYDDAGEPMWVATYNNGPGAEDSGLDVAVDALGNIYVAGSTQVLDPSGSGSDYLVLAYDPLGELMWFDTFDGPAGGNDFPTALAVSDTGMVYVTGYTWSPYALGFDWLTVAYDAFGGGLVAWYHVFNSPADGYYDVAEDLDTDMFGNVYVTGRIWVGPDPDDSDFFTIAYEPDGEILWWAGYDGPAGEFDGAWAIDVTPAGDVYVTGQSDLEVSAPASFATVAYDSLGVQQWVSHYDGPVAGIDVPVDIVADVWGNVYVTGRSLGSDTFVDFATVAYSPPLGTEIWAIRYDGEVGGGTDDVMAVASDDLWNVYVTGQRRSAYGLNDDYATVKYSYVVPTPPDLDHLENAVDNQQNSFSPEFWKDGKHLSPLLGYRFFDERKKAVMELRKVMDRDGTTREDRIVYETAVRETMRRSRDLVVTLHDEISRVSGDPKVVRELESCRADLASAEEALRNVLKDGTPYPLYDRAMDYHKLAWIHARNAERHVEPGER